MKNPETEKEITKHVISVFIVTKRKQENLWLEMSWDGAGWTEHLGWYRGTFRVNLCSNWKPEVRLREAKQGFIDVARSHIVWNLAKSMYFVTFLHVFPHLYLLVFLWALLCISFAHLGMSGLSSIFYLPPVSWQLNCSLYLSLQYIQLHIRWCNVKLNFSLCLTVLSAKWALATALWSNSD